MFNRATAVGLSIAVHILIVFTLVRFPITRDRNTVRTTPESIEVELLNHQPEPGSAEAPEISKANNPSKRLSANSETSKSALNFSPKFEVQSRSDEASGVSVNTDESGYSDRASDDPNAGWGSGSGDFARVEDLGKFNRLYQQIETRLVYPAILARNKIQGTVKARLVLTEKGCDWKRTRLTSHEAHLKIYILDVLKKVCAQDLSRYAKAGALTNVDFSFQFELTEHNDLDVIAANKKIVGNVFLFYRNSHQSVAEWKLGPIRGMFPVPYIALDFDWLQENWERAMHSRDPMSEFADHMGTPDPI